MPYWTGTLEAITAANNDAFAAYLSAHPTAYQGDEIIPNPTTAWDSPVETIDAGVYSILAYPDMPTPEGCNLVDSVSYPQPTDE
jgi:hypothetical protein